MSDTANWLDAALRRLIGMRSGGAAWGYQAGSPPSVEPTVLAALALLGTAPEVPPPAVEEVVARASTWLGGLQQGDGSVGVSGDLPEPRWPTALAALLWSNVGGHDRHLRLALDWLGRERGKTYPRIADGPVGHDTSIAGWPWAEGTHAFVEPTSLAILAFHRSGTVGSSRAADGVRLLHDRAIESGGWNYGNNVVLGARLRPQPGPTGLALLALACGRTGHRSIGLAIEYLEKTLPGVRSAQSLAWGVLGLSAWGRRPSLADDWLREVDSAILPGADGPFLLSHLILASGGRSLATFGLTGMRGAGHDRS